MHLFIPDVFRRIDNEVIKNVDFLLIISRNTHKTNGRNVTVKFLCKTNTDTTSRNVFLPLNLTDRLYLCS